MTARRGWIPKSGPSVLSTQTKKPKRPRARPLRRLGAGDPAEPADDRKLDTQLKQRAAAAQIPTSALVRRLLRQAMREPDAPVLTEERVEAIARRVLAEAKGDQPPARGAGCPLVPVVTILQSA